MAKFQNPVIVIPGITATTLVDEYPLDTREVWTMVLSKEFDRLSLHPYDLRYETMEPARVVRGHLFAIYEDLVLALRHDLSPSRGEPTPVFPFPYDWRKKLSETAAELRGFIDEVIARTALVKHYDGFGEQDGGPKVDLVGHSMGGLVIAEYLSAFGGAKKVGRVATLGTPFLGSVDAVVKLATGLGNLTGAKPSEREREAARTLPAIYHLIPSFPGAAVDKDSGKDVDLFLPGNWQASIIESLASYIERHAMRPGRKSERLKKAEGVLGELLDAAKTHRGHVEKLELAAAGLAPADWLAIIGVGRKTRVKVEVTTLRGQPRFYFDDSHWQSRGLDTGDGTVPLKAAMPPFLDTSNLVCISPRDLRVNEVGDWAMMRLAGFHAILSNVNLAQRLVIRHFRPSFTGKVWGRPVPGVATWNPPIPKLEQA